MSVQELDYSHLRAKSKETLSRLFERTVLKNKWIPHVPTPKQAEFLMLQCKEALYGGAAGGGKSDALLMAALQYVDVPGYSAIIFRRTYQDLMLHEALIDRSLKWLGGTKAHWNAKDFMWIFPSGAKLQFGYLKRARDTDRYQGAEFQSIGFDEVTQFVEKQYLYLFSRLRKEKGVSIPLRMRCASNPGGVGHVWVKRRFLIEGPDKGRVFIRAKLKHNPHLNIKEYMDSLKELDPITRRQLLDGDWSARHGGGKFDRKWFEIVKAAPVAAKRVRYWDMAATTPTEGKDPDYTVGAKLAFFDGITYIENIIRRRITPSQVEQLVKNTCMQDREKQLPYDYQVCMEIEPGSAGIALVDHYRRNILQGFTFRGCKTSGSKEIRANPVSSAAEGGVLKIVEGKWIGDFFDEAEGFPLGEHDDQVDAVSGAFENIHKPKGYIII